MKLRKASVWFFAIVLLALAANAMFLVLIKHSYDTVVSAQERRERSVRLSNELQQETDQLTRLVRAYTSTGEARYLLYYYDILAVREGEKVPPVQANPTSYWDAVIAGRIRHAIPSDGNKRSVAEMMKAQGFGVAELASLEQVLRATKALNKLEQTAFAATQGLYDPQTGEFVSDGEPRLDFAIQLVHSAAYNRLKDNLSQAVSTLVATTDQRSRADVAMADAALSRWIFLSLVCMGLTIVMAILALRVIRSQVLVPIHLLGQSADQLALGDYAKRNGLLRGFDELTSMGRTVDVMAQAIEDDMAHRQVVQQELESARKQAEDATHAKSMFLANMSHEIRTPMNAILGMAYLALNTKLNARQHDYVNKIHAAAQSLLGIINDILDFSKVEAGKLELEIGRFRVEDVASQSLSLLRQRAHDKDIELLFDVAQSSLLGESGALMGDALRLGQVLTNLLSNAVKFTHHGYVKLTIQITQRDANNVTLQFSVRDTGIGMTPDQISRLFQEFTQADGSTTRQYGGTGLGLTISKRIVELMDGRIWVDSVPSQGSSFNFTARLSLTTPPAPSAAPLPRADVIRLLVVDDQREACMSLADLLGALGVGITPPGSVDQADDGDTALAMIEQARAEQRPYDMLLLDWVMPRLDGAGVLAALQQQDGHVKAPMPVIICSSDMDALHETASALGAQHFLLKPVLPESLRELIKWLIGDQQQEVAPPDPAADAHDLTGVRVLLVEDNPINQQLAVELMRARGVRVDVASNGQEAIDRIALHRPNHYQVVLLDLQMPVMDGYETTRQLRMDARYVDLPIVAMTAHAMPDERQRCHALGMNGHISKPIAPELLYELLAQHLVGKVNAGAETTSTESSCTAIARTATSINLAEVSGLDARSGLNHAGGDVDLYVDLLRRFMLEYSDFSVKMQLLIDDEDLGAAFRLTHTLKGLCATLGVTGILSNAITLDKTLRSDDLESQTRARIETDKALNKLFEDLNAIFSTDFVDQLTRSKSMQIFHSTVTINSATPSESAHLLDELRILLSGGDNDARLLWRKRKSDFACLLGSHCIQGVTDAIENFDFGKASEMLEKHSKN